MNSSKDTIVALATPLGIGSIGVIRISGSLVSKISCKLLKKIPYPRQATYLPLYDYNHKNILDYVIVIFFPKPHSYTGENILEIHGHGGPVILDKIIQNILQISEKYVRIALPGEFSERAFINNKIDLIQAEAISDLINANSHQAAQLASNTLKGVFSKKIHKLEKKLSNLRIYIESQIDFPEEKIQMLNYIEIKKQIKHIIHEIQQIYKNSQENISIQQGIKIIITGKPNSGKSSLFNILSNKEAAIVTSIAGTTRDTLHEYIQLNGILVQIVDTAGLQENYHINNSNNQTNEIEKIGIEKTWSEIKKANHILLLIDAYTTSNTECDELQSKIKKQIQDNIPITIIRNKADLTKEKIHITHIDQQTTITISAKYNQGINLIIKYLTDNLKTLNNENENFSVRQRHLKALKLSFQHLIQANQIINNNTKNETKFENEIFAEELKYAHIALQEITGKFNSNILLKKIFSTFCIGK